MTLMLPSGFPTAAERALDLADQLLARSDATPPPASRACRPAAAPPTTGSSTP